MTVQWNDNSPIYRQLRDRLVEMMLDGLLKPGDALPSVRDVAAQFQLNPITVMRGFQELTDEQLIDKKRGLGMYMANDALEKLLANERNRFMNEEWPLVLQRMQRLGIRAEDLMHAAAPQKASDTSNTNGGTQ